jgi:putative transposase
METQIGKTRWSLYNIAYHLVWIPKYRRRVLTSEIESEMKKLTLDVCQKYGVKVLALNVQPEHIHLFVSAPPRISPARIVGLIKGYTSRYLREKFPKLVQICGKDQLWSKSYYVGTAGEVSAETITRYIQNCQMG